MVMLCQLVSGRVLVMLSYINSYLVVFTDVGSAQACLNYFNVECLLKIVLLILVLSRFSLILRRVCC